MRSSNYYLVEYVGDDDLSEELEEVFCLAGTLCVATKTDFRPRLGEQFLIKDEKFVVVNIIHNLNDDYCETLTDDLSHNVSYSILSTAKEDQVIFQVDKAKD